MAQAIANPEDMERFARELKPFNAQLAMLIPQSLERLINESLSIVDNHPQHDLPLGYRHAIYAKLGPRLGTCQDRTAHQRRTVLAFLTVRHVLPLWEQARPYDKTPHEILSQVEQILEGTGDRKSVQKEAGAYWTYMDNLAFESEEQSYLDIGYAAVGALYTACGDEEFDATAIDYSLTDEDVDAYEHDAVFAAAADYAGGATWQPESDAGKRREFWHWWLKEALPAAWWAVWQPEHGSLQYLLAA